MLTDDVLRIFADGLAEFIYALDDKSLEEQLVDMLKVRGKKIAVAEYFTGGGVAKRIVSVSGASEVYFEGLNTYNELSKIKRLGVQEYALKTFGVVSDETAYQMAAGLIATGDVDVAIATTGIAGPKSDSTNFPVGLAYIAVGTKEKVYVYRYKFNGNRKEITEKAINHALFLAYRQLKDI
jgi:nicotinamide-nucleotide amidase